MLSKLSAYILKLWGWKIVNFPFQIKKCLIVLAPHTSNWDFPVGILVKFAVGKNIRFIGKDSLFRQPFGFIFYRLGGYPVDRGKNNNFVQTLIEVFQKEEKFVTAIAPEGTRKKVEKLKTGFYHICKGANVPMILTQFDWENKEMRFGDPFFATNDTKTDFQFIDNYFRGVKGKIPENGYLYK